jgi:internalin A
MPESRESIWKRLRRPRINIRVMMVVVLLIAIGLGWTITGARRQAKMVEQILSRGGRVQYDWEYRVGSGTGPKAYGPKWLVNTLGPDYFHDVTVIEFKPQPKKLDESFVVRFGELDQLEILNVYQAATVTDAGFAKLAGLTRLTNLNFSGNGISGRAFAHLKGMRELMALFLVDVETVDDDLANLSGLTKLRSLALQGDKLTDAGLAHLRPLKNLESLQLAATGAGQITTAGLAHLSEITGLWQLVLQASKVDSLEPLRPLTSFKSLAVIDGFLNDEALAPLANFTKLEGLALTGKNQRFGGAGLANLVGLKSLNHLWLKDTKVGDPGLVHLAGLSSLGSLNLEGTRITDAGLTHLVGLTKLKELSLDRTAITDAGLIHLARLSGCNRISLRETKTTDAGIRSLQAALPGVRIFR